MYKKALITFTAIALVAGLGVGASAAFAQTLTPTITPTMTPTATPANGGMQGALTPTPTTLPGFTPVGGSTTTNVTPGAPNTGAGGDMPLNLILLLTSGAIAVGGVTYLVRSFYVRQD